MGHQLSSGEGLLRRGVSTSADRDQGPGLVPDLNIGAADGSPDLHRSTDGKESAAPRRPQPVDPEIDGGPAVANLGNEGIIPRDVDQRRDHPAVVPIGSVGAEKFFPEREAQLGQARFEPDPFEVEKPLIGRDGKIWSLHGLNLLRYATSPNGAPGPDAATGSNVTSARSQNLPRSASMAAQRSD